MQPNLSTQIRRHSKPLTALRIAIIVRTKNRPHLLTRSLQSLAEQKRLPDEIIVVNDGGVAIDDVVNDFSALNIHLIHNATNQGRSHAGNQGVQATNMDFIGFLDDDDRYLPDHLQRLEKVILYFDTKVAYAGCRLLKRDMLGDEVILQEKPIGEFNDAYDVERLRYENYIPLINLLIDRTLWLKVGGFDESFDVFEDWDVLLRLSKHTPFYHVNRITTEYAIWGGTQTTQSMVQKRWRDSYRHFLQKHLPQSEPEQLEYLAEYWRISQERRGIMQDIRVEKQALQSQLDQTTQSLEQHQQCLEQQQQLQQQYEKMQSEFAQLQSDWSTKYQQLQSDYNQLQSDWIAKYQQLQLESRKESAKLQSDWTAKYEQLQSDYHQLQSDWIAKYQLLQLESRKESAKLQSDWSANYQQLQSDYNQLQSDWTAKYQQLQLECSKESAKLQSDWTAKYQQLQSDHAQLQSDWKTKYQLLESNIAKKQAKMQATYSLLEENYIQSQETAQQQQLQIQSLQNNLHELSKQIAVGMNQSAIEQIIQSSPAAAYALATSSGNIIDDYQRLLEWTRNKAKQLSQLSDHLSTHIQPLQTNYQSLRQQLADLIKLISASHWPQIRRYANAVQTIDKSVEKLFVETENYISSSRDIGNRIGLSAVRKHEQLPISKVDGWETGNNIPHPLSDVYPTLISVAGSPENPQFMENVKELGTLPFLLEPGAILVFTVYCTLDDFFRFDIFFGTRLRINTCQVRIIIRELETPLREIELDALNIFDNRFHPISFQPIADSAGKTYQIEIDSPDANENSGVAVWCHPKMPSYLQQQNDDNLVPDRVQRIEEINGLPQWLQQSLLDLPLPSPLAAQSAIHIFMLFGITESTPILDLHLFLRKLGEALEQANSQGKVVICGQLNPDIQHYCQQYQLSHLETTQITVNLPTVLDWGKNQLKSIKTEKYIWCCDLNATPQPDIIERALEIITDCPNAALLVPMEKYADSKIRAGYALLMRDGVLETPLAGAPADHPYYAYRRTVEAASSQLVIIKSACLSQLDINEIATYHIPMYQLTEMIWQLKDQYEAIYEAALCYEHSQSYPKLVKSDYNHDSQYFYQRWAEKLANQKTVRTHQKTPLNPLGQPTVLVIDATLPMYDEDSGSLRLYTLLKLWVSLGYRITFFPDNLDSQFKYRHPLEALGIEVFHGNYRIADVMAHRQFDFALICRVDIGQRYIPFVRLLSPKTVIFYDTVDIHYIREQRQAEIENDSKLLAKAQDTKRQELANCLLANRVMTVTEDDGYHLQKELPNLAFSVLPNIHQQQPQSDNHFEQREGLVFIGNYNHQPNQDAVYYFVENVLPKIHAQLPNVCLYLIGSYMTAKMKALASETIKIVGWVDQVKPEFAKRRVFVSYLRYGAGMKGKLGQALSLGLPVVTTTIGAEGMGLKEAETALIADEPARFAEAVCRLYTENVLWEKLSRQGRDYIEKHYGEIAVRNKLHDLLDCYNI